MNTRDMEQIVSTIVDEYKDIQTTPPEDEEFWKGYEEWCEMVSYNDEYPTPEDLGIEDSER